MLRYLPASGILPVCVTVEGPPLLADCDPRIELHRLAFDDPRPGGRPTPLGPIPLWRRLARDLMATPDRYRKWSDAAARLAWDLARKYHAPVLCSVPPVSLANALAAQRRKDDPALLIDFRDAWIRDPIRADYYRNPLRTFVERRWEERLVSKGTAFLFATPSMRTRFLEDYPEASGRDYLLLNGYDEADYQALPSIPALPKNTLNVVYTGAFPGLRTPRYFLDALRSLGNEGIRLYVVGDYTGKTERLLRESYPDLLGCVVVLPRTDYRTSLAWQAAADLLLMVVIPESGQNAGCMEVTSKPFEYLRAGRPILASVPQGGDAHDILQRFAWVRRVPPDDPQAIAEALDRAWKAKVNGDLRADGWSLEKIASYRRDQQIEALAQVILECTQGLRPAFPK